MAPFQTTDPARDPWSFFEDGGMIDNSQFTIHNFSLFAVIARSEATWQSPEQRASGTPPHRVMARRA